jgi:hypothetical protein
MSEFDKSSISTTHDPRSAVLDRLEIFELYALSPTRLAELESSYRRALEVVLRGNYAKGDPDVAKTVARIVLSIWQQDSSCNFLRLTNRAILRYREQRALEARLKH